MKQVKRLIEEKIIKSLNAFPVVYIAGPRQSGKTTFVKHLAQTKYKADYITFDDISLRLSASANPELFLRSFKNPVVIDEVQMVPEIFRFLKIMVDEARSTGSGGRGKFLLTGSASVMALPRLSDALVGRMALHKLLPFSACETLNNKDFISFIFQEEVSFSHRSYTLPKLGDVFKQSSFPEIATLSSNQLQYEWCNGYLNTLLQRDVRMIMKIEKMTSLPNMLRLLSTRTSSLLNITNLCRDTGLNHITVKKYQGLLESLFLTFSIPAWSTNLGKRLIKTQKVYLSDLSLLAYLLNTNLQDFNSPSHHLSGQVFENFIAIELSKQLTFSNARAKLYHYRTASKQEVDFLLEGENQKVVAIEVKSKDNISKNDFRHIQALQNEISRNFHLGLIVYRGKNAIPFGKRLWAIPFNLLFDD